jgi:hypothetical protein
VRWLPRFREFDDPEYLGAKPGEPIDFLIGIFSRHYAELGAVVCRMDSDDPRARVVNSPLDPIKGLYVLMPDFSHRWCHMRDIHRSDTGRLYRII